jgi:hypothetical protein
MWSYLVDRCLKKTAISGIVEVQTDDNPYYLRGDFDGDGCPISLLVHRLGTKLVLPPMISAAKSNASGSN